MERSPSRLCIVTLLFHLLCTVHHVKCEAKAGIKITRRNINNLRYEDDSAFMAESEEELKILLNKVKEENEKSWLNTEHSKNEVMVSKPSLHGKQVGKKWK